MITHAAPRKNNILFYWTAPRDAFLYLYLYKTYYCNSTLVFILRCCVPVLTALNRAIKIFNLYLAYSYLA